MQNICPVCDTRIENGKKCAHCGYEYSKDYELHKTLGMIDYQETSTFEKRRQYEEKQKKTSPKKPIGNYILIGCIACIMLLAGWKFFSITSTTKDNTKSTESNPVESVAIETSSEENTLKEESEDTANLEESDKVEDMENDPSAIKAGDRIVYGKYEQDNNEENGEEPLSWNVLDVQDGKALIQTVYGIDAKAFHEEQEDITWENCSLREWLNDEFYNNTFSNNEKSFVCETEVSADPNPDPSADTKVGNDTTDYIFLLSIKEVEQYYSSEADRMCKATIYARENGAYKYEETSCSSWWLRTNGLFSDYFAATISDNGEISNGTSCIYFTVCVRPAMWIDLSAEPEKQIGENDDTSILVDILDDGSSSVKVGDIVDIGKYEQDNNPENGKEPIEWRVLEVKDGAVFVQSVNGLDVKLYNESRTDTTWETCTLRSWLNNEFIINTFGAEEQEKIQDTFVRAEKNTIYGFVVDIDPGNDTNDKIFLLSNREKNRYYKSAKDAACFPTEYALGKDAETDEDTGCCRWWLRIPGMQEDSGTAAWYYTNGWNNPGTLVTTNGICIRPAMWIKL